MKTRYVKLKARVPVVRRGLSTYYEEEGVFPLKDVRFLSNGIIHCCELNCEGKLVTSFGPVHESNVTVIEYIN